MRRQSASARFGRRGPCEEQYDRAFLAGSRLAGSRLPAQGLRCASCALAGSDAMSAACSPRGRGRHVALLAPAPGRWTRRRLECLIEHAAAGMPARARRHRPRRHRSARHLRRLAARAADALLRQARRGRAHHRPAETDRALMAECTTSIRSPRKKRAAPNALLVALNSVGRTMAEVGGSLRAVVHCSARWCWRRSARSRIRAGCASPRWCTTSTRSAGARCRSSC